MSNKRNNCDLSDDLPDDLPCAKYVKEDCSFVEEPPDFDFDSEEDYSPDDGDEDGNEGILNELPEGLSGYVKNLPISQLNNGVMHTPLDPEFNPENIIGYFTGLIGTQYGNTMEYDIGETYGKLTIGNAFFNMIKGEFIHFADALDSMEKHEKLYVKASNMNKAKVVQFNNKFQFCYHYYNEKYYEINPFEYLNDMSE
jgi:hypothetical protein